MDDLSFGVVLPTGEAQLGPTPDPRELVRVAVAAERLGFDSLWVNDSLLTARLEALTMLAALTPVTDRVLLGTGALLPVLRRPVQAAQVLASLDVLSGGRLVVGVGAGFPGRFGRPLHELSEVPWANRFARLDDTVALWRQLWTATGPGSFRGAVLDYPNLPLGTRPARPGGPPVWLGGATPAALERTGRQYDGWLPYPPDPDHYRSGLAAARAAAAAAGRPADAVTAAVFVTVLVADSVEAGVRGLDAFGRAMYGLPLDELARIQALVAGPPSHVAAGLSAYVAAGARHLVCRLAVPDLPAHADQQERLAELTADLRAGIATASPQDTVPQPLPLSRTSGI